MFIAQFEGGDVAPNYSAGWGFSCSLASTLCTAKMCLSCLQFARAKRRYFEDPACDDPKTIQPKSQESAAPVLSNSLLPLQYETLRGARLSSLGNGRSGLLTICEIP